MLEVGIQRELAVCSHLGVCFLNHLIADSLLIENLNCLLGARDTSLSTGDFDAFILI